MLLFDIQGMFCYIPTTSTKSTQPEQQSSGYFRQWNGFFNIQRFNVTQEAYTEQHWSDFDLCVLIAGVSHRVSANRTILSNHAQEGSASSFWGLSSIIVSIGAGADPGFLGKGVVNCFWRVKMARK